MSINKAMKAALRALSYPDPDIKKSYKVIRKVEKITSKRLKMPKTCNINTTYVERDGYNIPVRIFTPIATKSKGTILFFHGGGWVNGNIDTYMNVCIDMQRELSRTVISVDYRRAPEYKFPYATEDCYAVAKELFSGRLKVGSPNDEIILMGDSAGGNIAAALSIMARDRGEFMPQKQILIYPATWNDHSPNSKFESIRTNGTDYLLTSKRIVGYMELYIDKKEDLNNPYLAPLLEKDLTGQPDTLIITAEYCPLRDEGEEYGKRLSDSGNNAFVYRMPNTIHGYFSLPLKLKSIKKTYSVIRRFLGDDKIIENKVASWIRLDNAAKIFPPTTSKRDAKVFRFYCELNDEVDANQLQSALDYAIKLFPFYQSVLKKGIFWYYFEASAIEPIVKEENREPCAELYDSNNKTLLFNVSYYKKRINLEVYHALSDGEGALKFFQTIVSEYLKLSHANTNTDIPVMDYDASISEKSDDSFYKYYKNRKIPQKLSMKKAYHLKGERLDTHPLGIIECEMSVKQLLNKAHEYHTTLTAFLVAVFLQSIADGMPVREKSKPIIINVPVDLRQFFSSKSARNFFGIINIEYNFSNQSNELTDIIEYVSKSMKAELDKDKISERMISLSKIENLFPARIVPLAVKDPVLRLSNYIVEKGVTAAFSNLGKVSMPEEFAPYIKKFGVMCSTSRIQACMCSYRDRFVISFSSPFSSTDIQCRFFRALTQMGIDAEITSNLGSDKNVIL